MLKLERSAEPDVLIENGARWTEQFLARRKKDSKAIFFWPKIKEVPLDQLLRPTLSEDTAGHCAYCDARCVRSVGGDTIDHFRPKTRFPEAAYAWGNLFLCCGGCQKRLENWDELLLKPDEDDYSFYKYFVYDYATDEIVPNPGAAPEEILRAEATIRLFKLNDLDRPSARRLIREEVAAMEQSIAEDRDRFPYRFALGVT